MILMQGLDMDLQETFDDLMWDVRRSVRYHSRRREFFSFWHTLVSVSVVMAGSASIAAFGTALGEGFPLWIKLLPMVLVTMLGLLDIVLGLADKAALYADLMRQFIRIEQQLEMIRHDLSEKELLRLRNEVLSIELGEPPVLHVLNTLCHNELARAMGVERKYQIPVAWYKRCLANYFDFREHDLFTDEAQRRGV